MESITIAKSQNTIYDVVRYDTLVRLCVGRKKIGIMETNLWNTLLGIIAVARHTPSFLRTQLMALKMSTSPRNFHL